MGATNRATRDLAFGGTAATPGWTWDSELISFDSLLFSLDGALTAPAHTAGGTAPIATVSRGTITYDPSMDTIKALRP